MVAIKGLYQKRGWWYFSRMRGGVRKTIALETREESDAIRLALELANGPDLAIGGTLEGEIEAFVAFKLARNEFSRFSAENKRLTLKRFARWVGPRTPIPSIKTADLQRFYSQASGPTPRRLARSAAPGARLRADLQRLARRGRGRRSLPALSRPIQTFDAAFQRCRVKCGLMPLQGQP